MIDSIYIENEIRDHPVTLGILVRFPQARKIYCKKYTEVFNRKAQNFRLQKKNPALILAKKHKNFVLKAPDNYGIGSKYNYYFSHMMNCIYDCRYCFLQGMYRSANYVLFVNYQDFFQAITETAKQHTDKEIHFFSGYDCDSLALEPVTNFAGKYLPLFESTPNALIELRTKSTQIRSLLDTDPIKNAVIAYSLSPNNIAKVIEHKAPNLEKRLQAIENLQQHGWKIGLRFDPLIFDHNYQNNYRELFDIVFDRISLDTLHSVSLGSFRLPTGFFKTLNRLYPDEKLLASPLEEENGLVSYKKHLRDEMMTFCTERISYYIPEEIFFPCHE